MLYEEFTEKRKRKVYTERLYRDEKILCDLHCLVENEALLWVVREAKIN